MNRAANKESRMDAKVFGPLACTVNGQSVVPSAAKPRQVLALLLLTAPHAVSVDALIDELWGDAPPASALTTLQTYIMQLRRRLAAAMKLDPETGAVSPKEVLATGLSGYRLNIDPANVDVTVFRRLARAAMLSYESGDPVGAMGAAVQAVEVWSVGVLPDVPAGPRLQAEAVRLTTEADAVRNCRIEAGLELGRHWQLLGELEGLVEVAPLDEALCAQYMLAAYRCGKGHRALTAYGRLRRHLVDELGLEPGPRCRELQSLILVSDPGLDISVAAEPSRVLHTHDVA